MPSVEPSDSAPGRADNVKQKKKSDHWISWRSKPISYHKKKIFREGYNYIDDEEGRQRKLSPPQRRFVAQISRLSHPGRYARRRLLGWITSHLNRSHARMSDGYLMAHLPPPSHAIIAVCERQISVYENFLSHGERWLTENGIEPASYLKELEKTENEPLKIVPYLYDDKVARDLISFALNPMLLAVASRYFGVLPVLGAVRILYSPNSNEQLLNSQKFHIDPEGARQIKVFMAIREVTRDNGPFTFVPESLSRKMLDSGDRRFQVTRIQDAHIMEYAPESQWVAHVGKPGDAVFVDTSNCFHFGSRQSKHPRHLLYVQYYDPFSAIFPVVDPFKHLTTKWQQYPGEAAIFPDYVLARKL